VGSPGFALKPSPRAASTAGPRAPGEPPGAMGCLGLPKPGMMVKVGGNNREITLKWPYPLVNIQKTMERSTHFSWENPLFLWSFSIAMLNYQRVFLISKI